MKYYLLLITMSIALTNCSNNNKLNELQNEINKIEKDTADLSNNIIDETDINSSGCIFASDRLICEELENNSKYTMFVNLLIYLNHDITQLKKDKKFNTNTYANLNKKQRLIDDYIEDWDGLSIGREQDYYLNNNLDPYEWYYNFLIDLAIEVGIYIKNDKIGYLNNYYPQRADNKITFFKDSLNQYKNQHFNFNIEFEFEKQLEKLHENIKKDL